jgi:hypothetical protein
MWGSKSKSSQVPKKHKNPPNIEQKKKEKRKK